MPSPRGSRRAPRMLLLTQYFPPEVGAPQVRLMALAQELQRRGIEVRVVTAMPNYPRGEVFPAYRRRFLMHELLAGIDVRRAWIYAATGRGLARRMLNYLSFTATSLIAGLLVPRPDLVFVESPPLFLGITGYLVSRLRRVPFILCVSDLWPASAKELGIVTSPPLLAAASALERFLYRKAYRVAALTEGILAAVEKFGQGVLMPNGVDVDLFQRVTPAAALSSEPGALFVFAGTHGYAQSLDTILDAADLLRHRPDIRFAFVGDGPDRPRLQEARQRRGLSAITFMDQVPLDAMPSILSAARAAIVPLRDTPLFTGARPSKILPALACETAVIFAGRGEAAELINRHRCGLVVPPETPGAMAAAIERLADDVELAAELGANGRRLAVDQFSWSAIIDRWLASLPEPWSARQRVAD